MRPVAERFWSKVRVDLYTGCWEWTAARHERGYGAFYVGPTRRRVFAHRVAYELSVGPIPEGLSLDHLCRNTGCVRPDHLEPVPHRENVVRGVSPVAENAAKTRCPKGHEYDRTTARGDGRVMRTCSTCRREYMKAYRRGGT